MRKLNVAILAGGRSSEHDISRLSAQSIMGALDSEKYNPVAVLIERTGDWRLTSMDKLALPTGAPRPALVSASDTERAIFATALYHAL